MAQAQSILLIGNFDGVHLGHQALLRHARELAKTHQVRVIILTFESHPATILNPEKAPVPLMTKAEKQAALLHFGADEVHWLKPTPELLNQEPEAFIAGVVDQFNPVAMVEGMNFYFGKDRKGDTTLLKSLGQSHGFEVHIIEPVVVTMKDKTTAPVSSSLIRWLLRHGRASDAALALGQQFSVSGEVIKGEQRGRTIGFPTANLKTNQCLLPADGIYAGQVLIEGNNVIAAISIGTKPTFHENSPERVFEAFLLDFDGDLYGRELSITVEQWIRGQMRYPNVEELVKQIERDVANIRELADTKILIPLNAEKPRITAPEDTMVRGEHA